MIVIHPDHSLTDLQGTLHRCATRRVAELAAATSALRAAGWTVRGPDTRAGWRRPLLLAGERCGEPLDGARSDERCQGLVIFRGGGVDATSPDALVIDACAGLPLAVIEDRGVTTAARAIVALYLGPLPGGGGECSGPGYHP